MKFAYDGANRVTKTQQNGKIVSYVYDIPGRKRTLTYPGGRVITENTDPRSRLATIDDKVSPPPIVTYSYDLGNRVVTRDYRNGTTASYRYNDNNWITDLEHKQGATLIAGFGYDFDKEGNKRFENKLQDPTHSEGYVPYDDLYRLIHYKVGTLDSAGTVPVPLTQTQYDLDGLGNWDQKIKDGTTESRTHNLVNEITAIDITPPSTHESLSYDDNGNLTEDGRYRYHYDEENRLTQVTRKSDSAIVGQYQYDALSRRIQKIANPAGSSTETRYFYDDARIIEEQNASGTTQATYVYGNYIDEVLTMARGSGTFYYHQNSLWSVEAITDATATVVERYSYDAYGLPTITDGTGTPVPSNAWGTPHSANTIGNPWMFTGRQFDEETGIYFYRARYYDPVKGRFLQRDPLEYVDGMNLYEYVSSRPTYSLDPLGLSACCVEDIDLVTTGQFRGGKNLNDYFPNPKEGRSYWGRDSNTAGPFDDSSAYYGNKVQIVCKVKSDDDGLCKLSQSIQLTESNYPGARPDKTPRNDFTTYATAGGVITRPEPLDPKMQPFTEGGEKFLSFADPPAFPKKDAQQIVIKNFRVVRQFVSCCKSGCRRVPTPGTLTWKDCRLKNACVTWTQTIEVKDGKAIVNAVNITGGSFATTSGIISSAYGPVSR